MIRLHFALLLSCLGCSSILGLDDYQDQVQTGAGGSGDGGSGTGGAATRVVWNVRLGDSGNTTATGVAVNDDGSIVVVGMFDESITFEGDPVVVNTPHLYVAKLDASGAPIWGKTFDAGGDARPRVAVLPTSIFVAGAIHQATNFGTGPLTNQGGSDVLLLMLTQDGELVDAGAWGTNGDDYASDVVTKGTYAIMCGDYGAGATGPPGLVFGSELALNGNGTSNGFVVELRQDFYEMWSESVGAYSASSSSSRRVASGPRGIALSGSFNGTVNFDGTEKTSGAADDLYAWTMDDEQGVGNWVVEFGSTAAQVAPNIAVDNSGNLALAGKIDGEVDFAGTVNAIGTANTTSLYVLSLAASDGVALSHVVLGTGDGNLEVAADSANDIVVAGAFEGMLDGLDGSVSSQGTDVIIARMHRYTDAFVLDWLLAGGDGEYQAANDVALGAADVVVAGSFDGSLALDVTNELVSEGGLHAFVAKLQR